MFVVILIFDQLLFRPLIASADWFRLEQEAGQTPNSSWALTMMRRSRFLGLLGRAFAALLRAGMKPPRAPQAPRAAARVCALARALRRLRLVRRAGPHRTRWRCGRPRSFVHGDVPVGEIGHVVVLGFITLLRVAVLIALASLIWVPIGVWVGMRPQVASIVQPVAQFLAAFPTNLFFGFVVSAIVHLPPHARHLAQPPDDSRHSVVHPLQRHRRCLGRSPRTCAMRARTWG